MLPSTFRLPQLTTYSQLLTVRYTARPCNSASTALSIHDPHLQRPYLHLYRPIRTSTAERYGLSTLGAPPPSTHAPCV